MRLAFLKASAVATVYPHSVSCSPLGEQGRARQQRFFSPGGWNDIQFSAMSSRVASLCKNTRAFRPRRESISATIVALLLFGLACAQAAEHRFLERDEQPDFLALLPPPPTGVEQSADMYSVVFVHGLAPTNEVAKAKAEGNFSEFVFASAIGDFFEAGKLPKTEAFFRRVRLDSDDVVNRAKDHWRRLRPINENPVLNHGVKDKSFSYPSGHSTRGTIYALLLAEIYPERKEAILAIGRELGWHRVQLAMHYPSDIFAGRVLAQAIMQQLKADPEFQREFAGVKAELKAAEEAVAK